VGKWCDIAYPQSIVEVRCVHHGLVVALFATHFVEFQGLAKVLDCIADTIFKANAQIIDCALTVSFLTCLSKEVDSLVKLLRMIIVVGAKVVPSEVVV
jgi:hypothetical protein